MTVAAGALIAIGAAVGLGLQFVAGDLGLVIRRR